MQIINPVVAPDGKRLAFRQLQDEGNIQSLMVLTIGGKQADEILRTKSPAQFGGLLWTPDGRSLIFTQNRDAKRQVPSELWIIGSQEKIPNKIGVLDKFTGDLRLHPNRQKIVCTYSDKRQEVWVLRNFLPEERAKSKEGQK